MCSTFILTLLIQVFFVLEIHGRPKGNTTHRIVFGQDVPKGKFIPYQVSLQYFTKKGEHKHFCGGSIISPRHILTAAHCCEGLRPQRMSIVAGIRSLNDTTGTRSQVTKYTMHENYMKVQFNDVAVLNIEPPLNLSNTIQSIDVSNKDVVGSNVPVTLTGWGLRLPVELPFLPPNYESINFPNTLQMLDYFTLGNPECRELGMSELSDKEICALRKGSLVPRGACIGDSGGPLVVKTGAGPKQVGIVSYGFRVCGVMPDVYTRVSAYADWISDKLA